MMEDEEIQVFDEGRGYVPWVPAGFAGGAQGAYASPYAAAVQPQAQAHPAYQAWLHHQRYYAQRPPHFPPPTPTPHQPFPQPPYPPQAPLGQPQLSQPQLSPSTGGGGGVSAEEDLSCPRCAFVGDRGRLLSHVRATHLGYFPLLCEPCRLEFPAPVALATHKASSHPGQSPVFREVTDDAKEAECNALMAAARPRPRFVVKTEPLEFYDAVTRPQPTQPPPMPQANQAQPPTATLPPAETTAAPDRPTSTSTPQPTEARREPLSTAHLGLSPLPAQVPKVEVRHDDSESLASVNERSDVELRRKAGGGGGGGDKDVERSDEAESEEDDDAQPKDSDTTWKPSDGAVKRTGPGKPRIKCRLCDASVQKDWRCGREHLLKAHLKTKALQCRHCDFAVLWYPHDMEVHMTLRHPDEEEEFVDRTAELEPELERLKLDAFPDLAGARRAAKERRAKLLRRRKVCALCPWSLKNKNTDQRLFHAIKAHPGKPEAALLCKRCDFAVPWALPALRKHSAAAHPDQDLAFEDRRQSLKARIEQELFSYPPDH